MKINIAKLTALCGMIILSGCASPDMVERKKLGDENMTCNQIENEIAQCEKSRNELNKEKGVNGRNVGAALFFWPALIATHSNVNDAMKALDDRKAHLVELYSKKKCCAK